VAADGSLDVGAAQLTGEEAALLARLTGALRPLTVGRAGVWVEHKPFSVTLHARRATPADRRAALMQALSGPARLPGVHAMHGKDVVELRVRPVTKGDALRALRRDAPGEPALFAGDDVTDEDAFAALGPDDVGVKVGTGASAARHRVPDPDALAAALEDFLLLRRRL
jgi:trehalose-phosphatase